MNIRALDNMVTRQCNKSQVLYRCMIKIITIFLYKNVNWLPGLELTGRLVEIMVMAANN